LLVFAAHTWAEEPCHVVIKQDQLKKTTLNDVEVYVVNASDFDAQQCFKPGDAAQRIKQLKKDRDDYRAIAEDFQKNRDELKNVNKEYAALITRHEQTLDRSIALADKYEQNVQKYNQLVSDYDQLTVKFDDLAGKYRDFALTRGTPFTVEIGAGGTSEGVAGLLGVGAEVYKSWGIKAWAFVQEENSGALAGASFRF
jgi:hypothetical protein